VSFPRILVVTGSAGHGHVRAAQAVAAALRARHPRLDVAEMDALAEMPAGYRETYRRLYVRLVDRHPLVWRALYEATDRRTSALGHALTVLGGRRLVRRALAWRPDLVVCTHFLAPELLSRAVRRGRTAVPIHVVVTDHDAHRVWWYPEVSSYSVASDLVRARFVHRFGARADRVFVTGIPVAAAFSVRRDPSAVRSRLGLDPGRPVVLFLSAGFAAGDVPRAIQGVWADRPDVQVVAACGTNARLRRAVARIGRPAGGVLQVLGFTKDVADLVAAADLVVGKSGGITTSEVAALGRPLLVSASIPGQEERNADALVAAGAGVRAPTPEEVRWHVVRLLARPDDLRAMAAKARAFGRPNAADAIADRIADAVGVAPVWSPPAHGARATVPR
jgi:processive 1,2-diacylglycerol beta-glucosyltransferase